MKVVCKSTFVILKGCFPCLSLWREAPKEQPAIVSESWLWGFDRKEKGQGARPWDTETFDSRLELRWGSHGEKTVLFVQAHTLLQASCR